MRRTRERAGARDTSPVLSRVLTTLWPSSTVVVGTALRARATAPDEPVDVVDLVAVPSLANPRLLLPAHSAGAAAAALRSYHASASRLGQAKTEAVALAVRCGAARVWPQRIQIRRPVTSGADSVATFLSRVAGQPVSVAIYLGPVRAVQKPIVQLIDRRDTTIAFAKVGIDELTRALVRHESTALRFLGGAGLSSLQVPDVMHAGDWEGCPVLVTRALPRAAALRVAESARTAAELEIARVRGVERRPFGTSDFVSRLRKRVGALPVDALSTLVGEALERLAADEGDVVLPFGSWHGDWAPWNMARVATLTPGASSLVVWDWEQFESGVPLGFDAIHHELQVAAVLDQVEPVAAFERVVARSVELLQPFGVDGHAASATVDLYLLEIATRYLHDGEVREGGTTLGRLDRWLPAALARRHAAGGAAA